MSVLKVNISKAKGGSMGTPGFADSSTSSAYKVGKDVADDLKIYTTGVEQIKSGSSNVHFGNNSVTWSDATFDATFDFEPEAVNTYKFLGISVDENFRAVMPIPAGTIVIGSMFDRNAIKALAQKRFASGNVAQVLRGKETDVYNTLASFSEGTMRGVVTALKTGTLYEIYKRSNGSDGVCNLNSASMIPLLEQVKISANATAEERDFYSIILSLVHKQEKETASNFAGETSASSIDLEGFALSVVFSYWREVVKAYNGIYTALCCLDVWSELRRRIEGKEVLLTSLSECTTIDGASGVVSFSGISKNMGLSDENILRLSCNNSLQTLEGLLIGSSATAPNFEFSSLYNGSYEFSDDLVFATLSMEEMQALSIIDSLNYTDDDLTLAQNAFNMEDPDERALYVKSVIKSYEKNFKEFKPNDTYKVTSSLAQFVENRALGEVDDDFSIVSTDGQVKELPNSSSIDATEQNIADFKRNLVKVLKLLSKSFKGLEKGFV